MSSLKIYHQQDLMDCGVACMKMILNYYGSDLPLHQLRTMTGTDRSGVSAYGIKQAFEELGFKCTGVQTDLEQLQLAEVTYPMIAHVVMEEKYQHYIVIDRFDENQVVIFDPAKDSYALSLKEFEKIWTGVLLLIETTETYQPVIINTQGLFSFLPYLGKHKVRNLKIICLSVMMTFLTTTGSFYFQFLIDRILPQSNVNMLNLLSLSIIILYFSVSLANYLRSLVVANFANGMSAQVILDYLKHVLSLNMEFFGTRQAGEIMSRFMDANKIIDALTHASLTVIIDCLLLLIVAITLAMQNTKMFLMTILVIPIYYLAVKSKVKQFEKYNEEDMIANAELNAFVIESIKGIDTVKSINSEPFTFEKIEFLLNELIQKRFRVIKLESFQGFMKDIIQNTLKAIIIWYGARLVLSGDLSLGQLITFNILLGFFLNPLDNIMSLQPKIHSAQVAAVRMNEVLQIEKESLNHQSLETIENYDLTIDKVSFAYHLKEDTLKNISLSIPKNQKLAIIGGSGSGKSTLAKLLNCFHKPTQGNIKIGETNIDDLDPRQVRENILYLPQTSFFFKGTLWENLIYGLSDVPDLEKVICACNQACLEELISEPMGLNLMIEEGGSNLSGGQKQRLAIARSLLHSASVIIFDEVTSGMDVLLERDLMNNLLQINDRTIIFITHNLTLAQRCEKIVLMDQGQIKGWGNHFELMSNNNLYKEMIKILN